MREFLGAEVKDIDPNGTWTAVASAPVLDRDNERILPGALLWRSPSIPVHAGHSFKVESLIGRCSPRYDAKGVLWVDGRFGSSTLAQATRAQVVDGTLNTMSIVFTNAAKRQSKDGTHTEVVSGELVACDFVTIPSNPDALVLSARGNGHGMTVAEARRLADKALRDLVKLDLQEAARILERPPAFNRRESASDFVQRHLRSI